MLLPSMTIGSLVGLALGVAGVLVWTYRLGALWRRRGDPPRGAGSTPVSIIVPARNEAHNLPALLDSLRRLSPAPAEIIVVDDHSTDGTGAIAAAAGVRVVVPPPLPPGWMGKPWACRAGAEAARGKLLLFTDADTVHHPRSLGAAVAHLQVTGASLVSIVPTHIVRAAWERLQGVFQLLLLVATRAGADARRGERRFAIGQYLLFRRDAYLRLGGHDAVAGRVSEDLALAEAVQRSGGRYELLFATDLLGVRMYPEGLPGFVRGWRRNFREGMTSAGLGGTGEMIAVMAWLLGLPLALGQAAAAGAGAAAAVLGLGYLATAAEIARRQRALGRFSVVGAASYPLFTVLFVLISGLALFDGLRRAPVRWKARSLVTRRG